MRYDVLPPKIDQKHIEKFIYEIFYNPRWALHNFCRTFDEICEILYKEAKKKNPAVCPKPMFFGGIELTDWIELYLPERVPHNI